MDSDTSNYVLPDGQAVILAAWLPDISQSAGSSPLRTRLQEIWRAIERVIADQGGILTGQIGMRLLATWMVGEDPEQATHHCLSCAIALQQALDRQAEPETGFRIGVAVGEVVASRLESAGTIAVIGKPVDTASALAASAAPGQILVDLAVHQIAQARFLFRAASAGPLGTDGSPLVARLLEGPLARHSVSQSLRPVEPLIRLAGRDEELEALLELHDSLSLAVDPFLVLVSGSVGIGKSRLLREFSKEAAARSGRQALRGECLPEAKTVPYHFWKSLWKTIFGIQENLPEEDASDLFMKGVLRLWGRRLGEVSAVETAHYLGEMQGLNWKNSPYLARASADPLIRSRRAAALMRELLVRAAGAGPLVMIVDDLQFLDECSLQLFRSLLQPGADPLPLMVVAGVETEWLADHEDWEQIAYRQIALSSIAFTPEMVRENCTPASSFSEALLARIVRRSGGSPLFLEEIIRSLTGPGSASSTGSSPSVASPIPSDLEGMIRLRLDDLSGRAREVLQLASVAGNIFWVDMIRAAARQPVGTGLLNLPEGELDRVVHAGLEEAERVGIVVSVAPGMFEGETEYRFRHKALRDAAYDILPERYRKFYHFAVAKWLSERSGTDMSAMIARHFEIAGNTSTALRYYQYAADDARARACVSEALRMDQHIIAIRSGEHNDRSGK